MSRTRPLSIALVVPAFDRGGLEQVVLNLYRGYRARGWRAIVLVERNVAGYMLGRLDDPRHGIVFDGDEGVFLEAIAAHDIDAIHYHYSTFGLPEARRLRIRTLYTLHNIYTWLDADAFAHHASRLLEADRVVAVSAFVRDYFCTRAGIGCDRVDIVANGIDALWALPQPVGPLPDLPAGRFVFAMPASYFPVKHHPLAIRAAEILAARRHDFQLVLLGNIGDEDYAAHVEALLRASPARDRITQIDCLAHDAMAAFYRERADCVLLPTLQEGCSNVVLEAVALDRLLIVTDVGNAREAARLSPRVRVIERAEPDLDRLTPGRIAELSRSGETRNLHALVEAMAAAMAVRGGAAAPAELARRREAIGLERMIAAYARLLADAGTGGESGPAAPWEIPVAIPVAIPGAIPGAMRSTTAERLA